MALIACLIIAIVTGIAKGSVNLDMAVVLQILHDKLFGLTSNAKVPLAHQHIVWSLRLPRVLMAAVVGAGLAIVGVVMQAMVRNSLADPYMMGVSSGASAGAVSVLAFGSFAAAGGYALSLAAFAGALLATATVYTLARQHGQVHTTRLILCGVAVAYCLGGVTSLITLTSGQRDLASAILSWTLGSLAGARWTQLGLPTAVLMLGLAWLCLQARSLNALTFGDETAQTLGVNVASFRKQLFVVVSLLTGLMVAVSGAIGFVGLVIPHITRMVVGAEHRRVLPFAALLGALFLIVVDLLARTLFAPTEVPVGVITALLGGPFFIWMLLRAPSTRGVS